MTPDSEPVPIRGLLPAPDGYSPRRPNHAWWRLSSGSRLFARPGGVYGLTNSTPCDLDGVEADALCALAAVAWVRRTE